MTTTLLLAVGMLLVTIGAIPYLRAVLRGVVRPRLVSWGVWVILLILITISAVRAGETTSAILSGVSAVECLLVVIVGWRMGSRTLGGLDVLAVAGALIGLFCLIFTHDPLLAMAVTVAIDGIAYLPTLKHAWEDPEEESLLSFAISTAGNGLCLASALLGGAAVVGLVYPVYSVIVGSIMVGLLVYGRVVPVYNGQDAIEYAVGE
jgi:hypothetical protein